jgi:hypothetical protein
MHPQIKLRLRGKSGRTRTDERNGRSDGQFCLKTSIMTTPVGGWASEQPYLLWRQQRRRSIWPKKIQKHQQWHKTWGSIKMEDVGQEDSVHISHVHQNLIKRTVYDNYNIVFKMATVQCSMQSTVQTIDTVDLHLTISSIPCNPRQPSINGQNGTSFLRLIPSGFLQPSSSSSLQCVSQ